MVHLENMYCNKIAIIVEFLFVITLNKITKVSFRSNLCSGLQQHGTYSIEINATFCLRGNEFFEKYLILQF